MNIYSIVRLHHSVVARLRSRESKLDLDIDILPHAMFHCHSVATHRYDALPAVPMFIVILVMHIMRLHFTFSFVHVHQSSHYQVETALSRVLLLPLPQYPLT